MIELALSIAAFLFLCWIGIMILAGIGAIFGAIADSFGGQSPQLGRPGDDYIDPSRFEDPRFRY